jgi:hypothetical protein
MNEKNSHDFETNEPSWIHDEAEGTKPVSKRQKMWLTIGLIVVFPFCIWAGWFEFGRAHQGNWRAWVYTFEWPFFGAIAIYLWRRLIKGDIPKIPRPDFAALAKEVEETAKNSDASEN